MIFKSVRRKTVVCLRDELRKHRNVLEAFRKLPRVLKLKIQEYYMSRMPMLLCPECGAGYYQIFMPSLEESGCFMCAHNYYMLRFCKPNVSDAPFADDELPIRY